jgi:DUF2934 family protein
VSWVPRKLLETESEMTGVLEHAIRERAYAFWEQDGRPDGKALENWLRAEAEISGPAAEGITTDGKLIKPSRASRRQASPTKPGMSNQRETAP